MTELDDILKGTEPETDTERARGPDGRFISEAPAVPAAPEAVTSAASEPEPAPAPVPVAEPPTPAIAPVVEDHVPTSALIDERRKRQQYERELADLREQLSRQQPVQPPKDVWEDPAAYIQAQTEQVRAETLKQAQEMMRHQLANLSEQNARQRYTDYDSKRASLEARLESDPVLRSELNRHVESGGDLGEFVYKTASRLDEVQQYGNIEALVAKRVADELAKLKPAPVVPQSLNATPSPASNSETWSGPPPLEEILKRKR